MRDAPNERVQPITALEDLTRSLEKGEVDPSSVSVHDTLDETMREIKRVMGTPDLDYIGDFLKAASALIKAKAEKLLPPEEDTDSEVDDENEQEDDFLYDSESEWSNEALLAHLMEYRVFQDAVAELARRDTTWRGVFPRSRPVEITQEIPLTSTEIGLTHLLSALQDILKEAPREEFSHVPQDDLFLERGMDHIRACIREKEKVVFRELFFEPVTRSGVIAVFLALLELIRLREVIVRQDYHFGEIVIAFVPGG
ncbi:MAG: segregation/condensation protein A [Firmicutes bacterium]|nr:segregation/condensation protein A [Bacillota bacterium]